MVWKSNITKTNGFVYTTFLSNYVYKFFRDKTIIYDNPFETFKILASYGITHFYKLCNEIIFVYNNDRVGQLNSHVNLNDRSNSSQYKDNESIYQFGVILAYEGNDDIKLLLQRAISAKKNYLQMKIQ